MKNKFSKFLTLFFCLALGMNVWGGVNVFSSVSQTITDGSWTIYGGSTAASAQSSVVFPDPAAETGFPTGNQSSMNYYNKLSSTTDLGAKLSDTKCIKIKGLKEGDVVSIYWFSTSTNSSQKWRMSYATAAAKGAQIGSDIACNYSTAKVVWCTTFPALTASDIDHIENGYESSEKYAYFSASGSSPYVYAVKIESSGPVDPVLSYNDGTYELGDAALDLTTLKKNDFKGDDDAITYTVEGATIDGTSFTAETAGEYTVTATHAETSAYNEGSTTFTVNVKEHEVSTDATLSDLKVGGTTVAGFAAATETYNVELPYGSTNVPTVTATATDEHAKSVVVTPAASLPGASTVVVTAEDNTTTKTYTVNFTLAAASGANLLTELWLSNGVKAYIVRNENTATVKGCYLEGEAVPTVTSHKESENATFAQDGNTITVTAQNGDVAEYALTLTEVNPLVSFTSGETITFDTTAVDLTQGGYIYTVYGFDSSKGVKWGKPLDEPEKNNLRIREGKNRVYMFLPACDSVAFIGGSAGARDVEIRVNGVVNGVKKTPANGAKIVVKGMNATAANMVSFESNGSTNGDSGFTGMIIYRSYTHNITDGWATMCLPFATVPADGTTLYTGTLNGTVLTLVSQDEVPANTAFLVKVASDGEYTFTAVNGSAFAPIKNNDLYGVTEAKAYTDIAAENGKTVLTLGLDAEGVVGFRQPNNAAGNLAANRACLLYTGVPSAPIRVVVGEQVATDIESVNAETVAQKVMINGQVFILRGDKLYTAQGQLVK